MEQPFPGAPTSVTIGSIGKSEFACSTPIESKPRCIPPISHVPQELLHQIFRFIVNPSYTLDPSMYMMPGSFWPKVLKDMLNIVLVCWAWSGPGTGLLYEHVFVPRIEQIPPLLRTLESYKVLRNLIKSLTIVCFVPRPWLTLYARDIPLILENCPRLRNLTIAVDNWSFYELPSLYHCAKQTIQKCLSTLTHLQLDEPVEFATTCEILNHCTNLISLAFVIPFPLRLDDQSLQDRVPFVTAHLAKLEKLHFKRHRHDFQFAVGSFPANWELPILKEVVFDGPFGVGEFVRHHGANIQFLHIHNFEQGHRTSEIQPIVDCCPRLQHLVMPSSWHLPISHPTLTYVDLWSSTFGCQYHHKGLSSTYRRGLPQLQGLPAFQQVRLMDRSLLDLHELPKIFPPGELVDEHAIVTHRLPGVTIVQTCGSLLRDEWLGVKLDAWDEAESDSDDLLYAPSDEGSSESCSDTEDSAYDDGRSDTDTDSDYDREFDHDLALRCFDARARRVE
ncbi:hypothetical protein JAAARDRAFT_208416 [Jaapia argillacea MUCL 33604]|uniref:F-box domain-containing protein n=1 Tax=Jaapia argillacea MUCL 33604 TaxID=933084 RepID=A0A067PP63_9AGAM|nr:hypothetical protein JAAARDRAFT_208416 [Jaapia argillacea MUCL 33604]